MRWLQSERETAIPLRSRSLHPFLIGRCVHSDIGGNVGPWASGGTTFDPSAPDEDVFGFIDELEQAVGTHGNGLRTLPPLRRPSRVDPAGDSGLFDQEPSAREPTGRAAVIAELQPGCRGAGSVDRRFGE
jgi:hypothetical protein